MPKFGNNLLLIVGLLMVLGLSVNVFADDKTDTKRPKNTGVLTVKTTPIAYPVLVDGVQVGMSGVDKEAEFYLTPGNHKIEVLGPGKPWSKEITTVVNKKYCICLKMVETEIRQYCPYNISVSGPDKVQDGEIAVFSTRNTPPDKDSLPSNPLKYVWTVTPETVRITSGQGTDTITVDTTGLGSQTVTASVEVTDGFYDEKCRQLKSVPTFITPIIPPVPIPPPAKAIVFRAFDDTKAQIDIFVTELQSVPDSTAYIIYYQGRGKKPLNAEKIANRIKIYMEKDRNFAANRIIMLNGGMREVSMADVFVLKPGDPTPNPTPR